jgi:hypothetical protein
VCGIAALGGRARGGLGLLQEDSQAIPIRGRSFELVARKFLLADQRLHFSSEPFGLRAERGKIVPREIPLACQCLHFGSEPFGLRAERGETALELEAGGLELLFRDAPLALGLVPLLAGAVFALEDLGAETRRFRFAGLAQRVQSIPVRAEARRFRFAGLPQPIRSIPVRAEVRCLRFAGLPQPIRSIPVRAEVRCLRFAGLPQRVHSIPVRAERCQLVSHPHKSPLVCFAVFERAAEPIPLIADLVQFLHSRFEPLELDLPDLGPGGLELGAQDFLDVSELRHLISQLVELCMEAGVFRSESSQLIPGFLVLLELELAPDPVDLCLEVELPALDLGKLDVRLGELVLRRDELPEQDFTPGRVGSQRGADPLEIILRPPVGVPAPLGQSRHT